MVGRCAVVVIALAALASCGGSNGVQPAIEAAPFAVEAEWPAEFRWDPDEVMEELRSGRRSLAWPGPEDKIYQLGLDAVPAVREAFAQGEYEVAVRAAASLAPEHAREVEDLLLDALPVGHDKHVARLLGALAGDSTRSRDALYRMLQEHPRLAASVFPEPPAWLIEHLKQSASGGTQR